jgi:hypothetical protein
MDPFFLAEVLCFLAENPFHLGEVLFLLAKVLSFLSEVLFRLEKSFVRRQRALSRWKNVLSQVTKDVFRVTKDVLRERKVRLPLDEREAPFSGRLSSTSRSRSPEKTAVRLESKGLFVESVRRYAEPNGAARGAAVASYLLISA